MATGDNVYRFAAGSPEAPRSAVYRVWAPSPATGRSDVYVAMRRLGSDFKISLHGRREDLPARGHFAISADLQREVGLEERFLRVWDRPEAASDGLPDFQLLLLGSELRPEPPVEDDFSDVHWLSPPPRQGAVIVSIIIGTLGAARPTLRGADGEAQVLAEFVLADGTGCTILREDTPQVPAAFRRKVERRKDRMRREEWDFAIGRPMLDDPCVRADIGGERSPNGPIAVWIEVDVSPPTHPGAA